MSLWAGKFSPVSNDEEIVFKGKDRKNFTGSVTKEFIRSLGYEFLESLYCGISGCTFVAKPLDGSVESVVIKIGSISAKEKEIAVEVGELGIGPVVYAVRETGREHNVIRSGGHEFEKTESILVMEKLDVTLEQLPLEELTFHQVRKILDLGAKCVEEQFYHGDIHRGNVMFSRKRNRWYLIDFSLSKGFRNKNTKSINEEWFDFFAELERKTKDMNESARTNIFSGLALSVMSPFQFIT